MTALCPCGTKKKRSACCERYISGKKFPKTPQALMRSRYTAYITADIDYIQQTMRGPAAAGFDVENARQWAEQVEWLGLTVLGSSTDHDRGMVEFIARYRIDDTAQEIHECSEFHLIDRRWFYVGEIRS